MNDIEKMMKERNYVSCDKIRAKIIEFDEIIETAKKRGMTQSANIFEIAKEHLKELLK